MKKTNYLFYSILICVSISCQKTKHNCEIKKEIQTIEKKVFVFDTALAFNYYTLGYVQAKLSIIKAINDCKGNTDCSNKMINLLSEKDMAIFKKKLMSF